jgi:methionyl-tRNA formyltransferase
MRFAHVHVVGAGQMGGGIAQVVAASGRRVTIHDPVAGAVERALDGMGRSLAKLAEKGGADPEEVLARIEAAQPELATTCAYGVLIKEPLLSRYEMLNVHPSLLPRWRGAAPIERAIMAGDAETGVSIMRVTAGLDSGPVCLQATEPIRPDDDYGSLAARLRPLGGELLVHALDTRPRYTEQDEALTTYAHKIEARDRELDHTQPPEVAERTVRALHPHIGARLRLPDGSYLGVLEARLAGETLAPAGGRVRTDAGRLLLDCNGGALELVRIQPPGGRPMLAGDWLRGRPDPQLTAFWLDPALPGRALDELIARAREEWASDAEWAPHLTALAWRGDGETFEAARMLVRDEDPIARCVGAFVLGQLGVPARAFPAESAAELEALAAREQDPGVLATVAHAFGHLGSEHGLETLLALADHPDVRVRDGVATALGGRRDPRAIAALVKLSSDPEPEVRDWATFALGTLAPVDTPELRDALAARLGDGDLETRLEAAHGLALREDPRAAEPLLELLAHPDGTPGGVWERHVLREAAVRLGRAGDQRFARYLERG